MASPASRVLNSSSHGRPSRQAGEASFAEKRSPRAFICFYIAAMRKRKRAPPPAPKSRLGRAHSKVTGTTDGALFSHVRKAHSFVPNRDSSEPIEGTRSRGALRLNEEHRAIHTTSPSDS